MKIELILTGGTIGSTADKNDVIDTNPEVTASMLIDDLYDRHPSYRKSVTFNASQPIDLLSENLRLSHWNDLIEHLKKVDTKKSRGIIITHGTDTLAFTANLLAVLFYGIDIPVFLISSSKPLTEKNATGYDNFAKAVDLIRMRTNPSVYVPIKSKKGKMNVHGGNRLIQSADLSPDFLSAHHKLNNIGKIHEKLGAEEPLLYDINRLNANILTIAPYPGLDYNNYCLDDVDAVLHRTYHSSTVSAGYSDDYSVLKLKEHCEKKDIPVYFAPLLSTSKKLYRSTDEIIKRGMIPLYDMTFEMSYIYLLIKHSFM